ncbi:MAG TPA: hypothetical protein VFB88_11130 [Xanthobacteraceae bacterium]|jgi:hypothetical protein|nr:hypothetical protein [Xanthobacteraceae bacterium]
MRKTSFFLVVATAFILAMGVGGWTAMTTTGVNAAGKAANIDGFPGRAPIRGGQSVMPPVF